MMMFFQNWIGYARVLFAGALVFISSSAMATERDTLRGIALLIGNSEYEHLAPLANPENDVDAIEDLLDALGFETYLSKDRDGRRLKRDLENFLDDAQDADVALLYYAGHGIEAGGENYLVPVDADISDTNEGLQGLFPMNAYVDKLHQTVSVAVVLLDACRDNPFPSNYRLTLPDSSEPVSISAAGLEIPTLTSRGAMLFDDEESRVVENVVTMVGFAAQPSKAALDGEPGTNSPYAKAILRHLGASNSERFSTVMSMISEEVYLKTKGRQRPWVNQSIRRELYFGGAADEADADLAAVTEERRGLLVHIVGLSDAQRSTVESLAAAEKIPADIAYAIMRAAGISADATAADIEVQLRSKLETIVSLQENAGAFNNPDPEVKRLTNLADQAELEGALNAANRFRDMAKARVEELQDTREQQVEALTQRILEDAAVFEKSAQTKILLNDYEAATDDYETAIQMVKNWDADQAFEYRIAQLDTLVEAYQDLNSEYARVRFMNLAHREFERPTLLWNDTQRAQILEYMGFVEQIAFSFSGDFDRFVAAEKHFLNAIDLYDDTDRVRRGKAFFNMASLNYANAYSNWEVSYYEHALRLLEVARSEIDPEDTLNDLLVSTDTQTVKLRGKPSIAEGLETGLAPTLERLLGVSSAGILGSIHGLEGRSFMFLSHWRDKELYEQRASTSLHVAAKIFASNSDSSSYAKALTDLGHLHARRAARNIDGAAQLALDHYERALNSIDPQAQPVQFSTAFSAMLDLVAQAPVVFSEQSVRNATRHGLLWEGVSSAEGLEESVTSVEFLMGRLLLTRAAQSSAPDDIVAAREWFAKFKANSDPGTWLSGKADEGLATADAGLAILTKDAKAIRQAVLNYDAAIKTYRGLNSTFDEARVMHTKASTLADIALETKDVGDLNMAYAAYEAWLNFGAANQNAAVDRYKMGHLLKEIGLATRDIDAFDKASAMFSTSADLFAADLLPDEAVLARFHAATSLHAKSEVIGQTQSNPEALKDSYAVAVQAYRAVLSEPGDLSDDNEHHIHINMGKVLLNAIAFSADRQTFELAAEHFARGLQLVVSNGELPQSEQWPNRRDLEVNARNALSIVWYEHGELFQDAVSFGRSAENYLALAEHTPGSRVEQATYMNSSAYALILGYRLSREPAALDVALDRVRASVQVLEADSAGATMLPFAQGTLCDALIEKSILERNRTFAEQALPTCEESHAGLVSLGRGDAVQIAETSLARVRALLEN